LVPCCIPTLFPTEYRVLLLFHLVLAACSLAVPTLFFLARKPLVNLAPRFFPQAFVRSSSFPPLTPVGVSWVIAELPTILRVCQCRGVSCGRGCCFCDEQGSWSFLPFLFCGFQLFFVSKMVVSGPLLMCVAPLVALHRVSIIFNFFPWFVASFPRFQICWRLLGLAIGCSVWYRQGLAVYLFLKLLGAIQFFNISLSSPSFGLHLSYPYSIAIVSSLCCYTIVFKFPLFFCPTRCLVCFICVPSVSRSSWHQSSLAATLYSFNTIIAVPLS